MRFTITIELNGLETLPKGYSTMAELLKDTGIWCLYQTDGEFSEEEGFIRGEEASYEFFVEKVITHRN